MSGTRDRYRITQRSDERVQRSTRMLKNSKPSRSGNPPLQDFPGNSGVVVDKKTAANARREREERERQREREKNVW